MKLLFVTHNYLNGDGGSVYASRAFINAFACFRDVTLLCPVRGKSSPQEIDPRVCKIPVPYDVPRWRKAIDLVLGRIHRYFGILEKFLDEDEFDTVVFDTCYPSFRMLDKVRKRNCRIICIHHNCQCDYARDSLTFPERPLMLFWLRRCERQAVRGSDLNLTLTPDDKELLYARYDPCRLSRIEIAGVFEYKFSDLPVPSPVQDSVFIITGNLGARQNDDSLLLWLETYYPALKRLVPDAHLIIAGKNPSERLTARCRELSLELIASPAEMQPLLYRARWYICPNDRGGGIKLRIMDALRTGLPVLTHRMSARGYGPFRDLALFLYSDLDSFCSALSRMIRTEVPSQSVQEAYRASFSFSSGVSRLERILQEIDG